MFMENKGVNGLISFPCALIGESILCLARRKRQRIPESAGSKETTNEEPPEKRKNFGFEAGILLKTNKTRTECLEKTGHFIKTFGHLHQSAPNFAAAWADLCPLFA